MKDSKLTYQMTVVLNPKTEEKAKDAFFEKVESLLNDLGGKTAKKEKMGLKDLSYPIKGHNKGDFWIFDLEADKSLKFADLELVLNRDASVIRYLLLKI